MSGVHKAWVQLQALLEYSERFESAGATGAAGIFTCSAEL